MVTGNKKQAVCVMAGTHRHQSHCQAPPLEQRDNEGTWAERLEQTTSTKTKEPTSRPMAETNSNNEQAYPSPKRYNEFNKVFSAEEEGNAITFADQTGQFPKTSSKGNQYIMVLVHLDSNGILQEPMKNLAAGKMIRAYQCLIDRLGSAGITPKHHILDNE
jgi:hypothetical protein